MKAFHRFLTFILVTALYGAMAAFLLFVTILPCGLGPGDDNCGVPSEVTIWSAIIGVVLVYSAICLFFLRLWSHR